MLCSIELENTSVIDDDENAANDKASGVLSESYPQPGLRDNAVLPDEGRYPATEADKVGLKALCHHVFLIRCVWRCIDD